MVVVVVADSLLILWGRDSLSLLKKNMSTKIHDKLARGEK